MTPSRRAFIVTALVIIGAGCASALFVDFGPDREWCKYEGTAEPLDPAEDLPHELNRFQRMLVNQTIRQEQATAYYGPRPLQNDSYVAHDGAYYRVRHIKNYTTQLPALVMTVEWEPGQTPPENSTVVNFSTLPAVDRLALRSAVYGGIYQEQVHPKTVLDYSESPILYPRGTGKSDLAISDHLWVNWDGRTYEITIHGNTTTEKIVHQYNSERVATDAESFRRLVADRYIIRLDNLTSGEREILDAAITGGYQERTESPSQTWDRLYDRLRETDFPKRASYVEYDGEWYRLRLISVCTSPA